jgi:hypothetical protein
VFNTKEKSEMIKLSQQENNFKLETEHKLDSEFKQKLDQKEKELERQF